MNTSDSGRLCVILCTERSGSTLLSVLLGGHSRVLAPPETHLFRWPVYEEWLAGYPMAHASLRWLMNRLEADDVDPDLRFTGQSPSDVWRWLLDRAGPGRLLVEKTPAYVQSRDTLNRIELLQPFYLHLVRHPIAVAASHLDRTQREVTADAAESLSTGSPKRLVRSAGRQIRAVATRLVPSERRRKLLAWVEVWADQHRRVEEFLRSIPPDRQRCVQFESLVSDPESTLSGICAALELEFQTSMLDPNANLPDVLAKGIGDYKISERNGIDAGAADAWRDSIDPRILPADIRQLYERLATAP
jgi:hypothetical protein